MSRAKKQPKRSRRERYGVWQFYLTKALSVFQPILLRVAKGLGLTVAEFIRDAVLEKLARHDEEAAERYRDWLELQSKRRGRFSLIEFNGLSLTVSEWAERLGLSVSRVNKRLKDLPIEEALTEQKQHAKLIEFDGLSLTVSEWAERLGLDPSRVYWRLRHWPLEKALGGRLRCKPCAKVERGVGSE